MGCAANMPQLQEEFSTLVMDCLHDRLPCLNLLLCVDAWRLRVPVHKVKQVRWEGGQESSGKRAFNGLDNIVQTMVTLFTHPCPSGATTVASLIIRPPFVALCP